ncbi:hypothetical protein ACQRIU_005784 [Beauveria bassiana]
MEGMKYPGTCKRRLPGWLYHLRALPASIFTDASGSRPGRYPMRPSAGLRGCRAVMHHSVGRAAEIDTSVATS